MKYLSRADVSLNNDKFRILVESLLCVVRDSISVEETSFLVRPRFRIVFRQPEHLTHLKK